MSSLRQDPQPTFVVKKLALVVALGGALMTTAESALSYEEVLVTGRPILDSEMAALETKRNADNTMEVISADTIGRFPDQNLADSLGRLPGLAIERDQGQARYINMRGAPFRYTSIAFDGIDVPGAESGRIPRFDSFPSVITSRVEANKAVLPSMPGESVAGYINVHTFNPFDQEGWSLATDIGVGEQSLGDGDVEKYSGRLSWSGEQFGAVVFGSQNRREQITDNREYDLERDASGELVVNELDFRSYEVEREDHAWGGRLEYRGDGAVESLFASTLYSEFVDTEHRNQFVFAVNEPQPGISREDVGVTVTRMLQSGGYENSTFTNTLGTDLALGEWLVKARLNRTETEFGMDLPMPRSSGAQAMADFDLSDMNDPLLWLDRDLASLEYPSHLALQYYSTLDVETDKFKLDAERDFTWFGREATLALGSQLDVREGRGAVASAGFGAFPESVNIQDFDTGVPWTANTTNSIGGTLFDNQSLFNAWVASGEFRAPEVAPENRILIGEDITALYAMVTTYYDWGNLVLGSRAEQTDYTSEGTSPEGPVSVSDEFTHLLPSVHANIDLSESLKLRLSGTSGLSRPTYTEWRAAASINVSDRQIRGGNPALEPEESRGVDASLEWYFAPASILSVGAFHRSIDNVIYADAKQVDAGNYLPSAAGEMWDYTGSVNGDDGQMSGLELSFTGHASEWFPGVLEGMGVSANFTLLDTEFRAIDGERYELPGTSETLYNASVFYENDDWSLRLNYQYRDEWISPIEDPSEYWGEQERVDFNASYTLPTELNGASIALYLNANNLTDETDVRYSGNDTLNQSESYGRHYTVGVRLNY